MMDTWEAAPAIGATRDNNTEAMREGPILPLERKLDSHKRLTIHHRGRKVGAWELSRCLYNCVKQR
jgi:hypothetical protein